MVHLGHAVFFLQPRQLGAEQVFLQPRVIQFGVGVRQFQAVNEQLEPLGNLGVTLLPLGERAHGRRIVDDEHRPRQMRLDRLLEHVVHEHGRVFPLHLDMQFFGDFLNRGRIVHVAARVLLEQVAVLLAGPGRGVVDFVLTPRPLEVSVENLNRVDEDRLRQFHHRFVVAIRLVQLDHREFWVVRAVDAFVSEHPANLVHPLDPTDHQPLEVQLQRDPQVELHIERIVMRRKGPCRGPTCDRMQNGRFRFDEIPRFERAADRVDDLAARQHPLQDAFVVDQVDVPLPQQHLDIPRPMEFFRRLRERLREKRHLRGRDRLLARPRDARLPVDANDVAQIDQFDQLPVVFGKISLGDHHLDATGPVFHMQELELPAVIPQQDTSGDPHLRAHHILFGGAHLARLADGLMVVEPLAPGVQPQLFDRHELLQPGGFEAVGRGRSRGRRRQGNSLPAGFSKTASACHMPRLGPVAPQMVWRILVKRANYPHGGTCGQEQDRPSSRRQSVWSTPTTCRNQRIRPPRGDGRLAAGLRLGDNLMCPMAGISRPAKK